MPCFKSGGIAKDADRRWTLRPCREWLFTRSISDRLLWLVAWIENWIVSVSIIELVNWYLLHSPKGRFRNSFQHGMLAPQKIHAQRLKWWWRTKSAAKRVWRKSDLRHAGLHNRFYHFKVVVVTSKWHCEKNKNEVFKFCSGTTLSCNLSCWSDCRAFLPIPAGCWMSALIAVIETVFFCQW